MELCRTDRKLTARTLSLSMLAACRLLPSPASAEKGEKEA